MLKFNTSRDPKILRDIRVLLSEPGDSGTSRKTYVRADFEIWTQSEIDDALALNDSLAEILSQVVVNWGDVANENGELISCSEENKALLFDAVWIADGFFNAYYSLCRGQGKGARRKN